MGGVLTLPFLLLFLVLSFNRFEALMPGLNALSPVTFSWSLSQDEEPLEFLEHLRSKLVKGDWDRSSPTVTEEDGAECVYKWHDIVIGATLRVELMTPGSTFFVRLGGGQRESYRGIAMQVDGVLKESSKARDIRWFTLEDRFGKRDNWRRTPC